MTRIDMHKKVIEHYGWINQTDKAREELLELRDSIALIDEFRDRDDIKQEMADVLNCLEQLQIILAISDEELSEEQDYKMERTLERMKTTSEGVAE